MTTYPSKSKEEEEKRHRREKGKGCEKETKDSKEYDKATALVHTQTPTMVTRRLVRARPAIPSPRIPSAARLASSNFKTRRPQAQGRASVKTPAPSSPAAGSTYLTFRRVILTGAVALVTAVGAITGARLKSDSDTTKQVQQVQETTFDERIEILENRRARLVAAKVPLERKLTDLQARMADKKKREAEHEFKGRGE